MSYLPASTYLPSVTASRILAPQSYLSGYYYFAQSSQLLTTSSSLGNSTVRVAAWVVTSAVTISAFNAETTVAGETGSVFRIGAWKSDGSGGAPGTLLIDAGTIPADGSTGVKEVALGSNLSVTPGLYWIGGAIQNASTTPPTMRAVSAPLNAGGPLATSIQSASTTFNGYINTAAGAFGNFSGFSISNQPIARIGFKVA